MLRILALTLMAGTSASAHDVTAPTARRQSLLEYVASRADLSAPRRAAWDRAIRRTFGGKALKDGSDEGVTVAKSVIAAAIFFDVEIERGVRAAYDAYHDTYRWVPPPIAINFQVLSFQGDPPAASARQMALDFSRHFDADIAPELVAWWEARLVAGEIPKVERARVREQLSATRALMRRQAPSSSRTWPLGSADSPASTDPAKSGSSSCWPTDGEVVLVRAVMGWLGTPYRMGGSNRRGVDCSAFVRAVYREAFALELPRNSRTQYHVGREVSQRALLPGDLIFFDTLDRGQVTHVGIYLGEGVFVHASSSRGVMRTSLDKPYYQRAYVGSRRPLQRPPS